MCYHIIYKQAKMPKWRETSVYMNINLFYEEMGLDSKNVLNRLGSEALILKYLRKFCSDESLSALIENFDAKNYSEAFRAAHTMKGICLNLDIMPLVNLTKELTELLRNYTPDSEGRVTALIGEMKDVYTSVIEKINLLQD